MTTSDSLPQEDPSEPSFAHGPVDPSGDEDTAELDELDSGEDDDTDGLPGPPSNAAPEPTG